MKAPSPIHGHHNTTGHEVSLNNFSIVDREYQSIARAIKEAMLIRVNDPSLNRNIGKFQLPHIWDEGVGQVTRIKIHINKPLTSGHGDTLIPTTWFHNIRTKQLNKLGLITSYPCDNKISHIMKE